MKELTFLSKRGNGGFCDRLVGIVSSYLIAKKNNRLFKIIWDILNIDEMFTNVSYIENNNTSKNIRLIDYKKSKKAKNFLLNILPSNNNNFSIESNMNWHYYLYNNDETFINETKDTYNILLNEILGVNNEILNKINHKYSDITERIGIQIRTGDKYFREDGVEYIPKNKYKSFSLNIKTILNTYYSDNKKLFITSDDPEIISELKNILGLEYDILTTNIDNIHIDKTDNIQLTNLLNLFEEFYLLSNSKEIIGMGKNSNFSLVASLLNNKKIRIIDTNCNINKNLTNLDFVCKILIN
jgi:hypothetical protein